MSSRLIWLSPLLVLGCGSPTPPPPPVARVASIVFSADSLAGDSLPILAGDTTRITAKALDANGKPVPGITPAWSSSDTTVALVSSTGLVTAVNPGDADISVTYANATNHVHGKIHATLLITPPNAMIDIGESVDYTAEAVNAEVQQQWGAVVTTWTSSVPQVATISSSGHAVGITAGVTLITGTATVKGKPVTATVKLVVTKCGNIEGVLHWNATISVTYNAGPLAGEAGTGTTLTASQGSTASGTLDFYSDTAWSGAVTGVANVSNSDVGPKGTIVQESATNQALGAEASLELQVYTDGPTCTYQLVYQDWTQWQAFGGGTTMTVTGPLGITTIDMNLPPPSHDSGYVLQGTAVAIPATSVLQTSGPGQYKPITGVGSQVAMLYPGTTVAKVTYRISEF